MDRSPHLDAVPLSNGFELSEAQVDELMELLGYERADDSVSSKRSGQRTSATTPAMTSPQKITMLNVMRT